MKSLVVIVLFAIMSTLNVMAQSFNVGGLVIPAASCSNFQTSPKVGLGLMGLAQVTTTKSYHNFVVNTESVGTIHGWCYSQTQDIYVMVGKNFNVKGGYLGFGWEHVLTNGDFTAFGFIEIGTNWATFAQPIYTVGIIIPFKKNLWKR